MDFSLIATFLLIVGLELVLGIDNILLISILTDRLEQAQRARARIIGLSLALIARCGLLLGVSYLVSLSQPVLWGLSWKDLILISGGGFLLFKAVKEIHHTVEAPAEGTTAKPVYAGLRAVITQIVALDIVFSIDSVITAVGLTDNLYVIYSAVILAFLAVLIFSSSIARFISMYPALKILALSFLVTIGVTLVVEGLHGHVPKGYIYLPMGFALIVELLQMRASYNKSKKKPA